MNGEHELFKLTLTGHDLAVINEGLKHIALGVALPVVEKLAAQVSCAPMERQSLAQLRKPDDAVHVEGAWTAPV